MKHIITLVIALVAMLAQAQSDYGKWILHPMFAGENITNCIDVGDEVYYLASDNLYRYDKDSQENEHLNRANYLSDSGVKNIYYNQEKNYIMVAYQNSNIDVIDVRSGDVSNMSDIKNADIASSKTINDITFAAGNKAIVATDFGFVIYNDKKLEVESSFISDKVMQSAMILGEYLIANSDGTFYYAPAKKHIQQMSDFKSAWVGLKGSMVPIADNMFFVLDNNQLSLVTATVDGDKIYFATSQVAAGKSAAVYKLRDGGYVASFVDADYHYTTNASGGEAVRHEGGGIYASLGSGGDAWFLDEEGLHHTNGETITDNVVPNAISISKVPFWMIYDTANEKLVLTSTSDNAVLDDLLDRDINFTLANKTQFNTFDGVLWEDITPAEMPEPDGEGSYCPGWFVFSPNEANTYYFSTRKKGIYKVTDGKFVANYVGEECGFIKKTRMPALKFDSQGNLWILQTTDEENPVRVLTPAKQTKTQLTAQDFIYNKTQHISNVNHSSFKRAQFAIGAGDTKVAACGHYQKPIVIWNNNSDLSVKKSISFASGTLPDQDGKNMAWYEIRALTADNNGMMWMGTTSGMIAFDPSKAFDADFHVTHIKVPRNDGTNLADYLLDGQTINCIAVDGANRKWIGTNESGLFLVSADGQQVLKNFNASNSVLGTNQIYHVCCDPTGNAVFVTTPFGLAEYVSDATPGQASYSNIYAYPNPVRPDYGGPINITGLMENSLVKIADPSGNVICSLKSTGGMVSWDGCNYNGDLVPTGVYTIIASQADGSGAGTTKVLIVR
ncbi:MAG: hypothetical protein IK100_10220 [Muribaculaceae bacterium]|nr:hypothetical protein [Muribaculaceae bacterium]